MDWGLWGFPSFWTRQSQVHARWSHLLPGFWAHGSCSCPHHGGLRWWHQIGGVTELDGLSTFHAGGGMCSWSCETRLGRLKMLKVKGLTFRWIFVVQPIKSEWNILMKTHEYWYIHISPIEDWWVVFFRWCDNFLEKGKSSPVESKSTNKNQEWFMGWFRWSMFEGLKVGPECLSMSFWADLLGEWELWCVWWWLVSLEMFFQF